MNFLPTLVVVPRLFENLFGKEAELFAIDNPVLAAGILGLALGFAVALTGYLWVRFGSQLRIQYRAWRKVLWVKFGTSAVSPIEKRYRAYLERRYGKQIRIATEGAAFRCPGYLFLTSEELGFVTLRLGVMTEMSMRIDQILEAHISKGAIYDTISISSKSDTVDTFRVFRGMRDVGQEFFNALQLGLGAIRFHAPSQSPAKPR